MCDPVMGRGREEGERLEESGKGECVGRDGSGEGREEAHRERGVAMESIGKEHSVPGEDISARDIVEQAPGVLEAAAPGIEGDELGGEEVGRNDGEGDEAGVKLLALAEAAAVGPALEEAAIRAEVRHRRQSGNAVVRDC